MTALIIPFPKERMLAFSEVYVSEQLVIVDSTYQLIHVAREDVMFDNYIPRRIHIVTENGIERYRRIEGKTFYADERNNGWFLLIDP